ncbi:uncharacterized protein PAC_06619 [Phialocephala subalpina]|uniref:Peptide hydrolase n=1 Tax=Phialocephala subalpina TaxID=576137 RepID=A0A1L7WVC2_9HELO|nr:uncharacterized protein PAC_06619 [Phialocephala subalpina]
MGDRCREVAIKEGTSAFRSFLLAQFLICMQKGIFFMDTTNYRNLGNHGNARVQKSQYPEEVYQRNKIIPLLKEFNKTNLQTHLEYLTSFHNRWYNSTYGEASYHWLFSTILTTIALTGAHQHGITAVEGRAPRVDDDGSGTVTILQVLRVLLGDEDLVKGKVENTLEFHWYAAEEGGMLGSQDLFSDFEKRGRDMAAISGLA